MWTGYGAPEVLQLREVATPEAGPNQVLIRLRAASVTAGDTEMCGLRFPFPLGLGIRLYAGAVRPKRIEVIGQDFAGEVAAVGPGATRFREGDRVFGSNGLKGGSYAEYVARPEAHKDMSGPLELMPASATFDDAAAVPTGALEALHFLREAGIRAGEHVLIRGSGGSIGTFGVQLAKDYGAEVTAVDSGDKLPMLRSIGADHVIDYTEREVCDGGARYDVIFDVVGKTRLAPYLACLAPGGRYLLANPRVSQMMRGRRRLSEGRTLIAGVSDQTGEDLVVLRELIAAGRLRSVIDRRFPLAETAVAHRYVESGRKRGSVVITIP